MRNSQFSPDVSGRKRRLGVWTVSLLAAASASGGSLETDFAKAVVKDLPIGHRTELRTTDGRQYTLRNHSDRVVEVRLTAAKPFPTPGQRRTHTDVPDAVWLTAEPATLTLQPGQEAKADLHLAVPDDPRYANQKYEVWLLAQTQGEQLGVGLITRIQFNTVDKPKAPDSAKASAGPAADTNAPSGGTGQQPKEK
jgi:hypothetical protein